MNTESATIPVTSFFKLPIITSSNKNNTIWINLSLFNAFINIQNEKAIARINGVSLRLVIDQKIKDGKKAVITMAILPAFMENISFVNK